MAINIEGAIRGDDPRIPKVESLNGVTILGFLNGKVVSVAATLIDLIDITTNYLPYIGEDYYAYVWNKESQVYVKTEIYVKGEQGEKGSKGDTGLKGDKGEQGEKGDTGAKGDKGPSIELQVTETYVQWRVVGTTTWGNLIALSQLKGDTGAKGDTGDTGAKGDKGDTGPSNTLSIGTVAGGNNASASITGIAPNQTLNLVLPKGDKGDTGLKGDTGEKGDAGTPNSLSIGTVTSGETPEASITGVSPSQTLNLTLPKGDIGPKGDTGEKGDTGIGVPTGGTTGQQLMKKSNVDYDFEWETPAGVGDMLKSEYDKNGDGVVDNAEKVNGFTVGTNVPANAKFTDTTYGEITEAEINTGTASTLRTITARRVTFILNKVSTLISNAISALTKNDVGLGNLDNIQQATKAEFNTHNADGTRHITAGERSAWGAKWDYNESTIKGVKVNNAANADTVNGKTVAVNVPSGAKFTDTVYSHPTSHPYSMITGTPTSLPANGGSATSAKHLLGDDTRSVNSNPSVYMSSGSRWGGRAGWQTEFKTVSSIGATSVMSGTYCYLQTHTPWSDSSGGYPIQVIYGADSPSWRVGVSTTAWSAWTKFADGGNASTVNGRTVLSNVPANAKFTDTVVSVSHLLPKSGGTIENYVEKLTTTTGAINLNSGNVFHRDATANTTFSITNAKAGAHSFTLIITMGATVRTLTFPSSVKWQDGEVPEMTEANKTYILTFMTINSGTTWFGMEGGSF